jgi:hypothetical protein
MVKTISYLNDKTWYRLVKLLFILFFLVVFSFVVVIIFSELWRNTLDIPNSRVVCQYGNEKQFTLKEIFKGKDMPVTIPDVFDMIDSKSKSNETILNACSITKKTIPKKHYDAPDSFKPLPYRIEKQTKNNIGLLLIYSILTLIITAIVFEILRRSFYYVYFGSIKPKK